MNRQMLYLIQCQTYYRYVISDDIPKDLNQYKMWNPFEITIVASCSHNKSPHDRWCKLTDDEVRTIKREFEEYNIDACIPKRIESWYPDASTLNETFQRRECQLNPKISRYYRPDFNTYRGMPIFTNISCVSQKVSLDEFTKIVDTVAIRMVQCNNKTFYELLTGAVVICTRKDVYCIGFASNYLEAMAGNLVHDTLYANLMTTFLEAHGIRMTHDQSFNIKHLVMVNKLHHFLYHKALKGKITYGESSYEKFRHNSSIWLFSYEKRREIKRLFNGPLVMHLSLSDIMVCASFFNIVVEDHKHERMIDEIRSRLRDYDASRLKM